MGRHVRRRRRGSGIVRVNPPPPAGFPSFLSGNQQLEEDFRAGWCHSVPPFPRLRPGLPRKTKVLGFQGRTTSCAKLFPPPLPFRWPLFFPPLFFLTRFAEQQGNLRLLPGGDLFFFPPPPLFLSQTVREGGDGKKWAGWNYGGLIWVPPPPLESFFFPFLFPPF